METKILERDFAAGTVKIEFQHKDVTCVQSYDLKLVVPGTELILMREQLQFTEEMQQQVINRVIAQVEQEIDNGIIVNAI